MPPGFAWGRRKKVVFRPKKTAGLESLPGDFYAVLTPSPSPSPVEPPKAFARKDTIFCVSSQKSRWARTAMGVAAWSCWVDAAMSGPFVRKRGLHLRGGWQRILLYTLRIFAASPPTDSSPIRKPPEKPVVQWPPTRLKSPVGHALPCTSPHGNVRLSLRSHLPRQDLYIHLQSNASIPSR